MLLLNVESNDKVIIMLKVVSSTPDRAKMTMAMQLAMGWQEYVREENVVRMRFFKRISPISLLEEKNHIKLTLNY